MAEDDSSPRPSKGLLAEAIVVEYVGQVRVVRLEVGAFVVLEEPDSGVVFQMRTVCTQRDAEHVLVGSERDALVVPGVHHGDVIQGRAVAEWSVCFVGGELVARE